MSFEKLNYKIVLNMVLQSEKSVLVLKYAILIICLLGVLWICRGQFENYITERTIINTVYEYDSKGEFPNIIFCSIEAFKPYYSKQEGTVL